MGMTLNLSLHESSVRGANHATSRRSRVLRTAGLLAATGWFVVAMSVSATAQAATSSAARSPVGPSTNDAQGLIAHSAASSYCAKLPATKISTIVKAKFKFIESRVFDFTLECIYFAAVPNTSNGDEIIISTHPRIPAGQVATLSAAERRLTSESPKNVKLVFTPLPALGPTAFRWSYKTPLNGGQVLGIADNRRTTGFGVLIGGPAQHFGFPINHLNVAERLLTLAMAA
jgi:hypothetical protein